MADLGSVGGGLQGIDTASPCVLTTVAAHGLADGDRISIGLPDGATTLCYVTATGYGGNQCALSGDSGCVNDLVIATGAVPAAGTPIVKLAHADFAVVAGINNYPAFASLEGPVADAVDFQQWLLTEAYVPHDQISLITSPNPPLVDPTPTLTEVSGAFGNLANKAALKPNFYLGRRFYIFLSGHGILPTRSGAPSFNETALLMANAGPITLGNHIGGYSYAEWFRAPGVFDEVLLFVDCCRDRMDAVALMPPVMTPLRPQRGPAKNFYAAATQMGSPSFEKPLGTPPQVRGVFSYSLMQALRSQSLCDATGMLTGQLLAAQLFRTVPALQGGQDPDIAYYADPAHDINIVARANPTLPTVCVNFADATLWGRTALLIGKNYPIPDASHMIDGAIWTLTLNSGLYTLKVLGRDDLSKPFEVTGKQEAQDVEFP